MKKVKLNFCGPNACLIHADGATYLQSYDTIIAKQTAEGSITLDQKYKYSKTTGKHRSAFLDEGLQETERKIKEGIYKVENLNK